MKPFLTTKRKLFDIIILLTLNLIFYFLWSSYNVIILFSLGFIWNWVASQDLTNLFENRRYRFSMLKLVVNLQNLILKPFQNFPFWVRSIVKIIPAGTFWTMVIFFNNSQMPWWMTFAGSFAFELSQLEALIFRTQKGSEL